MIDQRRADSRLLRCLPLRSQTTGATHARWLAVAVVLASIVLAACGGPEDNAPASGVAEAASEQVVTAEPAVSESSPEPSPAATADADPTVEPTATTEADVAEPPAVPAVGYDAPGGLVVPDALEPGVPGEFIASENFVLRSRNGLPMEGQRLLYHSQSVAGDDVAVSGFVVYPAGSPPESGWPLIAWAHGATGIADACAPSNSAVAFPNHVPARLVAEGFAVVATDYEGLGTPGRHPYSVGVSQAHSVLDSVRAVHNMDLPITDQWIAFGDSQGGQTVLFTAQLQPRYAPELELIGTIASAPPSQFDNLIGLLAGSDDYRGFLTMALVGQAAAFPEIDLATVFTPKALDLLDVVDEACALDVLGVFSPLPWEETVLEVDVFTSGPVADHMAEQDTNRLPTSQPLMIIHGGADELIPVESSALLLDQLCAFEGQAPIVRSVYAGETHGSHLFGDSPWPDLLEWAEARFAGEASPDDCER